MLSDLKVDLLNVEDGMYSIHMYHLGYTHSVKRYEENDAGMVTVNEILNCHRSEGDAEKSLKEEINRSARQSA